MLNKSEPYQGATNGVMLYIYHSKQTSKQAILDLIYPRSLLDIQGWGNIHLHQRFSVSSV